MKITNVFVVGSGFMGSGIVENVATKGLNATVYDIAKSQLKRSKDALEARLSKRVQRGKMTEEEKAAIIARISYTTDLADCKTADVIIEAVSENAELKIDIMRRVDKISKKEAIIASNTSSISITMLGNHLSDPGRFVGMHFFSPVPVIPLLEIVHGLNTSDETLAKANKFGEFLGKTCIQSKDEAGFIINRMLIPMLNEACILVERGVGSIEEMDAGMKLGLNHPMGPLELIDMIGLDVALACMETMYHELGDPKYRPAVSLRRMVDAGFLGRKNGKGFYVYEADGTKYPNPALVKPLA